MSADDGKDPEPHPSLTDRLAIGEAPSLTDTLPIAETLRIVEAPVIAEVPEVAVPPFRRERNVRLREQVVRPRVSEPPKRFIVATKRPKTGVTFRQVLQLTFVVALVGSLLLAYLRTRAVTEVQKAVKKTADKSTDTL